MKKKAIVLGLFLSLGGVYYFTQSEKESSISQLDKKDKIQKKLLHSSKIVGKDLGEAVKQQDPIKGESSQASSSVIKKQTNIKGEKKLEITSDEHYESFKEEVLSFYQQEKVSYDHVLNVKSKIKAMIQWKEKNNLDLIALEYMKPEFVLASSVARGVTANDVLEQNDQMKEIPVDQQYAIKSFSESKDFRIILESNRFNHKTINAKRLSEIYSDPPEVVYGDDFVHGLASDEPVEPVLEGVNDND